MSTRVDVYRLMARIAILTDVPAVIPPNWIAKHYEGLGGTLVARGLVAAWNAEVKAYCVAGEPTTCLSYCGALNVNEIGLHPDGHSSFSPYLHGRSLPKLADKVDGFLDGLRMMERADAVSFSFKLRDTESKEKNLISHMLGLEVS